MYLEADVDSDVSSKTRARILTLQKRCVNCGSTAYLHVHHRIFRSEGEFGIRQFLLRMRSFYEHSHQRAFSPWTLHSIQNLVVLCRDCHEGDNGVGVHGGNEKLRQILRYSFTCKITGFNIAYKKSKTTF